MRDDAGMISYRAERQPSASLYSKPAEQPRLACSDQSGARLLAHAPVPRVAGPGAHVRELRIWRRKLSIIDCHSAKTTCLKLNLTHPSLGIRMSVRRAGIHRKMNIWNTWDMPYV
eukprot:6194267-Pleurochrysis_carterae.AAC.2